MANMQNTPQSHTPGPGQSRRGGRGTPVLNILILIVALLAAASVFLFVINRWAIVFHVNGQTTVTSECGEPYRDEGATAELVASHIPFIHHELPVVISTEAVNIHEPGTYTVTYTTRFAWITSTQTRTVNIVDTTPPVIVFNTIEDYYTLPHHPYEEEGFTATDNHDGDITDRVESQERDGFVYYSVSDESGNVATAQREIYYDDRNAPVFRYDGAEEVFLFKGDTWTDDVHAEDDADGDVTARIQAGGTLDLNKVGTYTRTYTVTDEWGNTATAERFITVKPARPKTPKKMDPKKVIYLTFDDGPGPYTEELLKILKKHKVKATFFVTAAYKDYQDLIKKEYKAGHAIGIHTSTHDYAQIYDSTGAYWDDFNTMQDIVRKQIGRRVDIFRFPGGSSNTVSANYCEGIMTDLVNEAEKKGYHYFDWNITSGDAGDTTSGDVMYENMMNGIHDYENSVILCHDVKDYTVKMMDRFLTDALKEGYTFLPCTSESPTAHHGINN